MKEYAIYPFEYMNITQRHDERNHIPHWYPDTNYSDKPIDEACKDYGRSYFVPQNDYIIEEIIGLDTSDTRAYTNTARLRTLNEVISPINPDKEEYLYITLTHINEDNLRQLKKGQILKKGDKLILEGTDGNVTGNHFHMTMNHGKYYGKYKNTNKSWVYCYEKSLLPYEAYYLNKDFTIIKNSAGYIFKDVPKNICGTPVERNKDVEQIEIVVDNLRARQTPNGKILGYTKKGIYNIMDRKNKDDYLWYEIEKDMWVAYDVNWEIIYEKEQLTEPLTEPPTEAPIETPEEPPIKESFIIKILKYIKKLLNKKD